MTSAEIERRLRDQAYDSAEGAAAAASDAEEALGDVIAAPQADRPSGPVHQDRVRGRGEDHRRSCRQGRRADEQVRKLAEVT